MVGHLAVRQAEFAELGDAHDAARRRMAGKRPRMRTRDQKTNDNPIPLGERFVYHVLPVAERFLDLRGETFTDRILVTF